MTGSKYIAAIALAALVTTGFGCGGGGGSTVGAQPVELDIWGVFDNEDNYDDVIAAYRRSHPNVDIDFREFRFSEYEDELIRAFAENRGPDIFLVHNTSLKKFESLITPMPETVTISYQEIRGNLKKEVITTQRTERTLTMRALQDRYVDVVEEDVVMSGQIYALPTGLDTLVLFWNRDLLNSAGIATPPKTWEEFQEAVIKLTRVNQSGDIVQSGAAIGTGANVERSADILSLIMLQAGTQMTDSRGKAAFDKLPAGDTGDTLPGLDATEFYVEFADPTKEVYTWNDDMPTSFEAFANGTTAMFFGYSYHIPLLRTASPKLNFSTTAVPQITLDDTQDVNYASYWTMAVARDSKYRDWAWDFIEFMSADPDVNALYLAEADKPPALRELISTQLEHEYLSPFANQVLSARSWYHGEDVDAAEAALVDLIDDVLNRTRDPFDAIELAADKVNRTL